MKKILSFILCTLMVLAIVPVSVFMVSAAAGDVKTIYFNEFDTSLNLTGGSTGGSLETSTSKDSSGALYYADSKGMSLGGGKTWTEPVELDNNSGELVVKVRYYCGKNNGPALTINGVEIAGGTSAGNPTIGGVDVAGAVKQWRVINLTVTISDLSAGVASVKMVDPWTTYTGTVTIGAISDSITLKLGAFGNTWNVDSISVTQVEAAAVEPDPTPVIPTDLFSTGEKAYSNAAGQSNTYTVKANGTDGLITIVFSYPQTSWQRKANIFRVNGKTLLLGNGSSGNPGYSLGDSSTVYSTWSGRTITVVIDPLTGDATVSDNVSHSSTANVGAIGDTFTLTVGEDYANSWTLSGLTVTQVAGKIPGGEPAQDTTEREEASYFYTSFNQTGRWEAQGDLFSVPGVGTNTSTGVDGSNTYMVFPTNVGTDGNAYFFGNENIAYPANSVLSLEFMLETLPAAGESVAFLKDRISAKNHISVYGADDGKAYVGSNTSGAQNKYLEVEAGVWYSVQIFFGENEGSELNAPIYAKKRADNIYTYVGRTCSKIVGAKYGRDILLEGAALEYCIDNIRVDTRVDNIAVKVTGYQKTVVDGDKYNVRFIASVIDLYEGQENVGFEVTSTEHGKSWNKETTTVYKSITANYGTKSVKASVIGGKYVTAYAITGIPAELGTVELVVRPYVTINGVKVYGSAITVNVNPITEIPEEETLVKKAVLLLGQSNMAGRGDVNSVEKIDDDRIYMMRNLNWMKMEEPIFTDKVTAGVGPAASFAKAYVETYDETLGLIPGAVGGTSLAEWAVGGTLYNNAVAMVKKALDDGTEIVGILWHQGEADTMNNSYSTELKAIVDALYVELGLDAETVPFIAGELFEVGSAEESRDFACYPGKVNQHLHSLEGVIPLYAVVSGVGFRHIGDQAHLDAPSARVLGYRYFEAYYELVEGTDCPYEYSEDLDSYLK